MRVRLYPIRHPRLASGTNMDRGGPLGEHGEGLPNAVDLTLGETASRPWCGTHAVADSLTVRRERRSVVAMGPRRHREQRPDDVPAQMKSCATDGSVGRPPAACSAANERAEGESGCHAILRLGVFVSIGSAGQSATCRDRPRRDRRSEVMFGVGRVSRWRTGSRRGSRSPHSAGRPGVGRPP